MALMRLISWYSVLTGCLTTSGGFGEVTSWFLENRGSYIRKGVYCTRRVRGGRTAGRAGPPARLRLPAFFFAPALEVPRFEATSLPVL